MHLCFTMMETSECKKTDIHLQNTILGIKGKAIHTPSQLGCKNVVKVKCKLWNSFFFLPLHTVIFQMQAKMEHTVTVN